MPYWNTYQENTIYNRISNEELVDAQNYINEKE